MVPDGKYGRNFMPDRKIHGESNVWNTAQGWKKIYRFDIHVGFE